MDRRIIDLIVKKLPTAFGIVISILVIILFTCCGPVIIEDPPRPRPILEPDVVIIEEFYCGDGWCDWDLGENYWNCIDCVDLLTGGPKNGYCGDGICFGVESMRNCWEDCRPVLVNSENMIEGLYPHPEPPKPPIPVPQPDPI